MVERVNGVSALLQALTVLVFYFLMAELFEAHGNNRSETGIHGNISGVVQSFSRSSGVLLIAFSASMFLAFSLVFWEYATKFEVFPLNNLFAVLILLVAVRIVRESTRESEATSTRDKRDRSRTTREEFGVLLLSFLAGLAFTHHQTILFVFPAVIFLLRRRVFVFLKSGKGVLLSFLSFSLGVLPFVLLLLWIAARKPLLNWGDVEGISGVLAALTRRDFGTFSSFLIGNDPVASQAPIEQIWFYLKSMVSDFSVVGIGLMVAGILSTWKNRREVFLFVLFGYLLSGFAFLMYANFPLSDSFNQVTVRRFHLLPNLFAAIFLAFGLLALYRWIDSVKARKGERRIGIGLGKAYLLLLFTFPILMNFSRASNRWNTLTEQYAREAYARTPEDALIMLSGDIPNMTADYYRDVVLAGKDTRIVFSPGQFHLDWFNRQLKREHPDLVIPDPEPGKLYTSTTQVIEANWGKWPIYVGPDLVVHDLELEEKFVLYPKHLLFLVKMKGEDLQLEDLRTENDELWSGIDLTQVKKVRKNAPLFEESIVFYYARHFYNTGYMYEEVGLHEDAIREYKRVLELDPAFKEALSSLSRVYGEKLDPPDYAMAIEYLQKFQAVLNAGDEEYLYAAQDKIGQYQEKFQESTQEEQEGNRTTQEGSQNEATPSNGDDE